MSLTCLTMRSSNGNADAEGITTGNQAVICKDSLQSAVSARFLIANRELALSLSYRASAFGYRASLTEPSSATAKHQGNNTYQSHHHLSIYSYTNLALTMEQSRALNALAPFLALAKSATSPRAASDLVTQATSAPNTYVFAELLQQPNIRKLATDEQYASHLTLLETFAWGTWESYKASSTPLPALSDAQARKLRLLSLLTIAAENTNATTAQHNLSYPSLCKRLDLESSRDLEQLVTAAIYDNLLSATLNPAAQTVVVTSVAPLRDLAPGSVSQLLGELSAWSGRCDAVLADLQAEVAKIEANAVKRAAREQNKEKQIRAATEVSEKTGPVGGLRNMGRQSSKVEEDDDAMEVDGVGSSNGSRKRSAAGKSGGRMGR